jgi:hypothetical protein
MRHQRRLYASGFTVVAVVLAVASTAYACTRFAGKLTISAGSASDSVIGANATPASGSPSFASNEGMYWCSSDDGYGTTIAPTINTTLSITVAPADGDPTDQNNCENTTPVLLGAATPSSRTGNFLNADLPANAPDRPYNVQIGHGRMYKDADVSSDPWALHNCHPGAELPENRTNAQILASKTVGQPYLQMISTNAAQPQLMVAANGAGTGTFNFPPGLDTRDFTSGAKTYNICVYLTNQTQTVNWANAMSFDLASI